MSVALEELGARAAPAGPDPGTPPPPEWRVALNVARKEVRRLGAVALAPAALGALLGTGGGSVTDLRAFSISSAFLVLLLAAATLVASHRAATRAWRDGTEELLEPTPASARARTGGHLLSVGGPVVLAMAAVAASFVVNEVRTVTVGDPILAELAVGPLLVAGAGCLGVLLARLWRNPFTPFLACVAVAASILSLNSSSLAASGARWFSFWVEGSLWWLVPRHSGAHAAYLAGLVGMAAVGALARHGVTRRLVVAAVAVVSVAVVGAALQMRQPAGHWRAANAMFGAPASVQECWDAGDVRYCAFPRFRGLLEYVAGSVASARAALPAGRQPPLTVSQRVTPLDLQYMSADHRALPHAPDVPRGPVRVADDGEIHPGLEFGWSPVQHFGLGVQVGAKAVGLPLVPDPATGVVCAADGQARTVVALWVGAHAGEDARGALRLLLGRVEELLGGGPEAGALLTVSEVDVYGGFAVSAADARLAQALLRRPAAEVRAALDRHWDVLVDPATSTTEAARLLGVADPPPTASGRFLVEWQPGLVRLGQTCT